MVTKCWEEVASATGLSVQEARERWRNIRTALVRNLKLQANFPNKLKRPYYLIDHLQFVLPYVKPGCSRRRYVSDPLLETSSHAFESIGVSSENVKEEFFDERGGSDGEDHSLLPRSPSLDNISSDGSPEPEEQSQPSVPSKPQVSLPRKRRAPQDSGTLEHDSTINKTIKLYHPAENPTISPMQHFFMSLLPEFHTMTEQQQRDFKIRTLMLIDEIKNGQTSGSSKTYDPAPSVQR
ncbi:hypothetical protein GE061_005095 [Apolygus lucorum]|uniref:MADF domain-containing protein n=1 Tax=Apolygus lucorum TaxID=248454 RepID=A0A6A4J4C2_APOLU|nr:hypothetical protein GE061_005095 [Apolygus lucorum]